MPDVKALIQSSATGQIFVWFVAQYAFYYMHVFVY